MPLLLIRNRPTVCNWKMPNLQMATTRAPRPEGDQEVEDTIPPRPLDLRTPKTAKPYPSPPIQNPRTKIHLDSLVAQMVKNLSSCQDSIPGLGRSPGEGNGTPLQYSCLDNPMDRGAWWAIVPGVTKSRIWMSGWHTSTMSQTLYEVQWWMKVIIPTLESKVVHSKNANHTQHIKTNLKSHLDPPRTLSIEGIQGLCSYGNRAINKHTVYEMSQTVRQKG